MLLMFPGRAFEILALPTAIPPVINNHYVIKFIAMAVLLLTGLYYIAESASRAGFFDKKLKLNKIAFLSGEVEAETQEKSSLLNNCLDEIVYFFSRLEPYRLVVFEDLDRLKTPNIFVKLREINKIVNNNLSGDNPLKFIYSVRDDVFSGAESRTKFFDFIIPIIPYMDRKNAFSLLNSKMERYISAKNSDCLRFTSYFIKDMRCMQNIVNEYKLFNQIVDNTNNPVNLYALVFYKNTYSHDYSLIDKDIGVIYTLIHQFRLRKLHDIYFTQLDEKEKSIRRQIKDNISEKATLHRDLRYEMINRFIPDVSSRFTCFAYIVPNSYNHALQTYAHSQLIDNEITFLDFLDPTKKIVIGSPLDIRGQHETFSDSVRSSLSEEYQKRKIIMGDDKDETYRKLQADLKAIKQNIRRRNAISLSELMQLITREKFESLAKQYICEVKTHDFISAAQFKALEDEMRYGGLDVLYYLTTQKYIDQDFMRSRSIFHEGGITDNDNEFIKKVAQDISVRVSNTEYTIDDDKLVVNELESMNFLHREAVFHHKIISGMIKRNDIRLDEMLASLFSVRRFNILDVFEQLIQSLDNEDTFIKFLKAALYRNEYLDVMLDMLEEDNEAEGDIKIKISAHILSTLPHKISEKDRLRAFAESTGSRIISYLDPRQIDSFLSNIERLGVCYTELFIPLTDEEIRAISFIGRKSLYDLNDINVGIVLSSLAEGHTLSVQDCQARPWTLAEIHSPDILNYMKSEPDRFVSEIFLPSSESADAVLSLLSLEGLSDTLKVTVVRGMVFQMNTLSSVPVEPISDYNGRNISFHDLFFRHDRIAPSWDSLLACLSEVYDAEVMSEYVSRHADVFGDSAPVLNDGAPYEIIYAALFCNKMLGERAFKQVLNNVEFRMDYIDSELPVVNLVRLIEMRKIPFNRANFDIITDIYTSHLHQLDDKILLWFSQCPDVFRNDADIYLTTEPYLLVRRLHNMIMYSDRFSYEIKSGVATLLSDYYSDNELAGVSIPEAIKIDLIKTSLKSELNVDLYISLLEDGYRNKQTLHALALKLQEPGLDKIFRQAKEATFDVNDASRAERIVMALQASGFIRDFTIREDGKFHVLLSRSFSTLSD